MTKTLTAGLVSALTWQVTDDLCTTRGGRHVFSTPSMVLFVERACIHLLEPYLNEGQGSVGSRVDIHHLAPTLSGMEVRAETTLTEVDERRLAFHVKVFDDVELVGEAEHERYVIDVQRYVGRLEKKESSFEQGRRPEAAAKHREKVQEPGQAPVPSGANWPREHLLVEADQQTGIAWLVIDRPDKLNVITYRMRIEMSDLIEALGREPWLRVLLIRGAGERGFSAGADMNEFLSIPPHEHASLYHWMAAPERIPQPVIAVIDGFCFGGVLELCLACDLRIVTPRAELALPEVRLGMMPGSGGGQRMLRLVGMSRAKLFCMTGMRLDGRAAAEWGLAVKVVEPERLQKEALAVAKDLASLSPVALRMMKLALNRGVDAPLPSALEMESKMYATLRTTQDYREGIMAWKEKRPPAFTGR